MWQRAQLEVEQGFADRPVRPVGDALFGGGLDLGLRVGGQVSAVAVTGVLDLRQAVFARDLDALQILEQVLDLLLVHRATADEPPR